MFPVFADPKTDVVFKRIFGAEARKPLLVALLNDLLELKGTSRIRNVQHLTLEQHVSVPKSKLSLVDVKCTTAAGKRFVVEMQVLPVEGFEKRIVYNASKAYVLQLRDGEDYPRLCDVVAVTICDFKLWGKKDSNGSYKVPMMSRWRMQEQRSGQKGLRQLQFAFLELPKYKRGKSPETLVEKWAYFFREAENLEVIPAVLSEGAFREALEVARKSTFTNAECEEYDRAKMAEQDARGALTLAHEKGHKEGHEQGHKEGEIKSAVQGVLAVLRARKIEVPATAQERIAAEKDLATLGRWLENAATAKVISDVIGVGR